MVVRSATQWPVIFPLRLLDGEIIDARVTVMHDAILVKFPVLVSIRPEPVAGIIVPLVGEAHSNASTVKCPQLLNKSVVQLAPPFPGQKMFDLFSASDKFCSIA